MKKTMFFITVFFITFLKAQTTNVLNDNVAGAYIVSVYNDELIVSQFTQNKIGSINTVNGSYTELSDEIQAAAEIVVHGNYAYVLSTLNRVYRIDLSVSSASPELIVGPGVLLSPRGLAFKGDEMYIAEFSLGRIVKMDLTNLNQAPEVLIDGLNKPYDISLNGDDLYIGEYGENRIVKINVTNINPVIEVITNNLEGPFSLAIDSQKLYFSELNGKKISRIDLTDLSIGNETIIDNIDDVRGIVVHGSKLYFVQHNINTVSSINLTTLKNDKNDQEVLKIYPNPANNKMFVNNRIDFTLYKVYNLLGKEVLKGRKENSNFIDISKLEKGTYILKLDNKKNIKFIKQ